MIYNKPQTVANVFNNYFIMLANEMQPNKANV